MILKTSLAMSLLLVAAWPVAAEPFHHPFGEWREYNRDWLAACPDVIDEDATNYYGFSCFASTASTALNASGLPAYKLSVLRNRLTGDIDIAVTVAADGVTADTSRPMVIAFAGEPRLSLDFTSDLETRYDTVNQFFIANETKRDSLLEAMRQRNALTLTVPLTGGKPDHANIWLSLRGLTASLDFMATYARKVSQY